MASKHACAFLSLGQGFIRTETLKEILRELDDKLTNEDLDNIIEEVDEDGSGTLDFDGKKNNGANFFSIVSSAWKNKLKQTNLTVHFQSSWR